MRRLLIILPLLFAVPTVSLSAADAKPLQVVAAENFYGDLAAQVGGVHVQVLSILSDPNVDPHEYESNVADAIAISKADLVIEGSGGYDDWMDKLLSASPKPKRILLKGFDLAPTKLTENEHVFYDPNNMLVIARALTAQFKKLDPANSADYDANLAALTGALGRVTYQLKQIKSQSAGTPVALTETIFLYQTALMGLKVLTPFEFQKAVAEGEDPSAASVLEAEKQIQGKKVKVLIYNSQTSTPVTTKLQNDAQAAGIPIVSVTETMPEGFHYQDWMLKQLDELQKALGR